MGVGFGMGLTAFLDGKGRGAKGKAAKTKQVRGRSKSRAHWFVPAIDAPIQATSMAFGSVR